MKSISEKAKVRAPLTSAGISDLPVMGFRTMAPVIRMTIKAKRITIAYPPEAMIDRICLKNSCIFTRIVLPSIKIMATMERSFNTNISVCSLICVAAWKMASIIPTSMLTRRKGSAIRSAIMKV
jgi:hypothetical protein